MIIIKSSNIYNRIYIRAGRYHQKLLLKQNYIYLAHVGRIKKILLNMKGDILDLGCGDGALAKELFSVGRNIIGIDISRKALKFASKFSNIKWVLGDVKELPFCSNSLDYVIASELIEHLTYNEAIKMLQEIRRVLKSDGKILLTTPNKYNFYYILYKFVKGRSLSSEHTKEYCPHELRVLVSKFFEIEKIIGYFDLFSAKFGMLFEPLTKIKLIPEISTSIYLLARK